jgi:oxygen-independent coproporphyrinogen-3 oxidase
VNARGVFGLYLHVPFCAAICSYCHFARTAVHDRPLRDRTVDAMIAELELRRADCATLRDGRRAVRTCYLGGGTPSLLAPDRMAALLQGTLGRLPRTADCEVTAEANPESFTDVLATAWREAGIDRVSLGVQSLDAQVLRLLGRRCDPATARAAIDRACRVFPRVSADWILGPGLSRQRILAELDEAVGRGVEHVSLYILELHPGTEIARAVAAGRLALPPDGEVERLYLACAEHLARLGLAQYEVSNFARPGAESRHNRAYWDGTPYLGLGPSASSYWGRRRSTNTANLATYLRRVEAGEVPEGTVDALSRPARRLESLVLGLRTAGGVPLAILPPGALDLAAGAREGLWTAEGGRLRLTRRGFLRIDTIEERLAAAC